MWAIASVTLVIGFMDDVRSRKVHNPLVVTLFVLTLVGTIYVRGIVGSIPGAAALMIALIATIPMFAMGVLGGGDVKLFAVFALALDVPSALNTLLYSLIWGALFGLCRAALSKQLLTLVKNTYRVGRRPRAPAPQIQKIPYTFALLLGWFTQLTLLRAGVG